MSRSPLMSLEPYSHAMRRLIDRASDEEALYRLYDLTLRTGETESNRLVVREALLAATEQRNRAIALLRIASRTTEQEGQ